MKKFTKTHEWIELLDDQKTAIVGITTHAAEELGDITYVELPEIGKEVGKGDVICSIESVKSASELYAPVSGKVIEVNNELEDKPELINEDPQGKGWIVKLEVKDLSEFDDLLTEEEYKNSL